MISDCVFCKIIDKKIPAKIIFENDDILAFEDTRPQAPVHILFVPKRHIDKVADMKDADGPLMGKMILAAKDIAARKKIDESGYRIILNCNRDAGQEVFHLHMHLMGGRKFSWPPG